METGRFTRGLRALETHWQIKLPDTFSRLYSAFEYPFISPCEFLPLDSLLNDSERWRGMLPQFLPIGEDGEENYFGFYVPANAVGTDFPVLAWDHEYDHYYPVASSFEAFLPWCIIYGRYLAQDSFDEDEEDFAEEDAQRREFAELVGLPSHLVTDPIPRNDRELNERIVRADGQNAWTLAQLGGQFFGQGQIERARDYFVRASEAAPWFSDPYYLLAETYRTTGDHGRACRLWWHVFESPISFSTRTSNYDLGDEHPETEIYEAAASRCMECRSELEEGSAGSPLWRMLQQGDPFSPGPRFALADALKAAGDGAGRERELLNALTLATDDRDISRAYEELIALYERTGRMRDAALCRRDSSAS
jgi:tetratricopeptide (TPR) repeat protein